MDINKPEDPRVKSNRYKDKGVAKFDKETFDFHFTQFLIDDNYIGDPPHVQISIDNLNDNINEKFLEGELTKLGKIRTLEIVRHPVTRQHLGLAKVQFEEVTVAQACVENFNGKQIMGRQLRVFKDLRFATIEKLKLVKLAPKQPQIISSASSSLLTPQQQLQTPSSSTPTSLNSANPHHPHLIQSHQASILPLHHSHLHQKNNSTGPIPSPLSLEYPITTPSSLSSTANSESSSSRQRLEDRIAILMKQPNCVLSTIVAPALPQVSPTYSAFSLNETSYEYANNSYYNYSQHPSVPLRALDRQRANNSNDIRRSDNNHSNHYQNHKEPYHKYIEKAISKQDKQNISDDDWDKSPPEMVKKPLTIELTEEQIIEEVLPFCYEEFYHELRDNLLSTVFKKLRETHGYPCIEKFQNAYKAKQDKLKVQRDKERIENELQKQFERRYMSKTRIERPIEAPRPKVNLIRQRTGDYASMQDTKRRGSADLRRVNRSSAYVAEPERRGSHNTSIDSEYSDSESSSSSSSLSSRSSSSSSSSSGSYSRSSSSSGSSSSSASSSSSSSSSSFSSKSSGSVSPYSRSSRDSMRRSRDHSRKSDTKFRMELSEKSRLTSGHRADSRDEPLDGTNSETKMDEQIAVDALLCMASKAGGNKSAQGYNDGKNILQNYEDESDEVVKPPPKTVGRKRKKKTNEVVGIASEYRAAKRFASDSSEVPKSFDENIENAMIDDEKTFADKPESKFLFPARSEEEKARILDDLFGTLNEEDLKYLQQVHQTEGYKKNHDVEIPFGSENANKAHLNVRKHMIEGKAAEGHPKWWRGCSRCDVIGISEKKKIDIEDINYEDLTRAPIKSHVIQAAAATTARRDQRGDQRGDQRRFVALNPGIDMDILKLFTTNTLKMRAKNLRFSRSKIHNWGLFACEKISMGDAVIEYVGEKIRPTVADHREMVTYPNLPTHDGSSYFFRVESDVIDATYKGNKARFINHSCNPNCIAKVIPNDSRQSIVIYAKQLIQEDEEITYDYKFPREETDQKIRCNCRAPNCQKFLN